MLTQYRNRRDAILEAEAPPDENRRRLPGLPGFGANLARMEMRLALEQVLRRMPDLQYAAGGPVLVPSSLVRSCAEMKVRFTPEA